MTWDTDEKSIQSSQPIELYAFTSPSQAWFLTSYQTDFVAGGVTYTATPVQRSTIQSTSASNDDGAFTVDIPATHPLAAFYSAGIPPRELTVVVTRLQKTSGFQMVIGQGYATGLSFKSRVASFKIASPAEAFSVQLPTVSVARACPHILFDARCTVPRGLFLQTTTIKTISQDRKIVTVLSMGNHGDGSSPTPDQWARLGEFVCVSTTERRTIADQQLIAGEQTLTLNYKLPPTVNVGDTVEVSGGCNHLTSDCFVKFSNIANHGGMPQLPLQNPFFVSIKYTGS